MTDNPFETTSDDKNYLEELVGEGKKFKTIEDLAKGKYQSDDYIEVLKAEITAKEAELKNKMALEDFYQKITNKPADTVTTEGQPFVNEPVEANSNQDIDKKILDTLKQIESERTTKVNEQAVIDKIKEVWGNEYSKKLEETAKTLGLSKEYLQNVARQSPTAFFKLTDLDQNRSAPGGTAVPTSTVNLGRNSDGSRRDAKYYRELKRTNPSLYRDPKTQVQMQQDAFRLGEAYFN